VDNETTHGNNAVRIRVNLEDDVMQTDFFPRSLRLALVCSLVATLLSAALTIAPARPAVAGDKPPANLTPDEWSGVFAQINPAQVAPDLPYDLDPAQVARQTAPIPAQDDDFGYHVAVSTDWLVVGAEYQDVGSQTDQGAAYVFTRNFGGGTDNWGLVKELTASDAVTSTRFGGSVAISGGETIVVGAVGQAGGGAAYVFERNQGGINNWGEVKKLQTASTSLFGVSVAVEGSRIAVGASWDSYPSNRGAVYLFERNQGGAGNWGQVKRLIASDAANGDEFGYKVTLDNDILAVAAYTADVNTLADAGAVYVFYRNDGGADNWGQRAKVTAGDPGAGDFFGQSVALCADTLVVGAHQADINGNSNQGAVYVYQRNQGGANLWGQVKKLTGPAGVNVRLGQSVACDGDVIVGGTRVANPGPGMALVYERNLGGAENWGQAHTITTTGTIQFGLSASLEGRTLALGSWDTVNGQTHAGAAYVYDLSGDGWVQAAQPTQGAAGDNLGWATALSNNTLLVGAPGVDLPGKVDAGAAYLFKRNTGGADVWSLAATLTAPDSATGDAFGSAVTLYDDTAVIGAPNHNGSSGAAYVFLRNQGGADVWGWRTTLSGAANDKFGYALSLSGDLLAVGAPSVSGAGRALLYERNQGGADLWGLFKTFVPLYPDGRYGYSVALDRDRLAIGAPYHDTPLVDCGMVTLYERNQGGADNWGQVKELRGPSPALNDHFGFALALDDDTLVAGTPDLDRGANADAGAAFIFGRNRGSANNWGLTWTISDTTPVANNRFGFAVAIDVDSVAAGVPRAAAGAQANQGAVLVFERNIDGADRWGLQQTIVNPLGAAEDRLGFAVALGSQFVASGAINTDVGANTNQGAVLLHRFVKAHRLAITRQGTGSGTVTSAPAGVNCGAVCTNLFNRGAQVTLTAAAAGGSIFAGWSGGGCSGTGTCNITLNADTTVIATFTLVATATPTATPLPATPTPTRTPTLTVTPPALPFRTYLPAVLR
jgi:hypothetical protein